MGYQPHVVAAPLVDFSQVPRGAFFTSLPPSLFVVSQPHLRILLYQLNQCKRLRMLQLLSAAYHQQLLLMIFSMVSLSNFMPPTLGVGRIHIVY